MGKKTGSLKRKRRLIEMACVDGAVIFDDNHLLAVGRPGAFASQRGKPAWGPDQGRPLRVSSGAAHPIKVSSDGDVTIYFRSRDGEQQCDAVMNFL